MRDDKFEWKVPLRLVLDSPAERKRVRNMMLMETLRRSFEEEWERDRLRAVLLGVLASRP